jgi:uncharacterized membrane protein
MRHTAIILAVVAMFSWGLWVVFAKLAGETFPGEIVVIITYIVGGTIGIGYFLLRGSPPTLEMTPVGIGGLAYYAALRQGSTAMTTTIAALYFVVASIIAWLFLGDPLRPRDALGIGLAVGAVAILAS